MDKYPSTQFNLSSFQEMPSAVTLRIREYLRKRGHMWCMTVINSCRGKGLPEEEVRRYTRSIIKGLIHIHKNQYIHCDLKPANILLLPRNSRFEAKIGDLGLARRMSKTKQGYCLGGTLMCMAPEMLIDNVQESPSDIWALGCVVLEMLTGNRPWWDGIGKYIIEKDGMPMIPKGLSEEARGFLRSCFVRKPEFRFTAEMLMFVPFVAAVAAEEEEDLVTAPIFVEKRRSSKRQRTPIQAV
ncbi:mitogen-activated protein kinase kinase kinase 17-like [Cucurbita moschata]|uniref:Mitogen-activated protein kinase kinase kinase 17-like n=1 Tax=Cucurbita moschata TaxID=3662 RepID=A0A6J1H7D9_CUCMO|nr:mitogen-activated protein kinase kinase kinase 17-like [Cucurbita moschata]